MTDTADKGDRPAIARRIVRIPEAAEYVFGDRSAAAQKRLARLADAGRLSVLRVGSRGDRYYSVRELDRLIASAETEPETKPETA